MTLQARRLKLILLCGATLAASACATAPAAPAGVDGSAGVSAEAKALHMRLLTLDSHLDIPARFTSKRGYDFMLRHNVDRDGSQVDYPRMNEGGLDGGFFAIYLGQGPLTPEGYAKARDEALLRAVAIHEVVAAHPDKLELATTAADGPRIVAAGKKAVYMSMENSWELGDDITLIDTFYDLGVRLIGPVHNGTNQLADSTNPGSVGAKWGGLSPMGKAFVKRANELGMVLDGSHSSDATIEQMIDLSATPIILSHHGADALNEHPRNAPDALLKKLAAKGGVIQVNTMFLKTVPQSPERSAAIGEIRKTYGNPDALAEPRYTEYLDAMEAVNKKYPEAQADFEDYMAQILYCLKLIGPEHVGFGADWDGGGGLAGYRDITYLPKVTERLLKEGYTEADLANMWGGNVLRVLKAAEDYSASLKN